MKVFSVIARQSFDFFIRAGKGAAVLLFAFVCCRSDALATVNDVSAVMMQCRDLAADNSDYTECLTVMERESERSLAGVESDWAALLTGSETVSNSEREVPEVEQLKLMATQFLEYRDNLCAFSANELDELTSVSAVQACRISMNRQRSRLLTELYVERRTRRAHGDFYRGYFLMSEDKGLFQSCDLRQDWIVDADDVLREKIVERYSEVTVEALELVYVEWRGRLINAADSEPMIRIERLNLLRPVLENDCAVSLSIAEVRQPTNTIAEPANAVAEEDNLNPDTAEDSVSKTSVATIDDYGASGFTYGYFGAWTSLCAADALRICQAQVPHSMSTEGDWQFLVDRSSDLIWRLRLLSVTDSHLVGSGFQVTLDGVPVTTIPVASGQILLDKPHTLLRGEAALQLLNRMKNSATLELRWNSDVQGSSSLIFPLSGVALALQYFDTQ